ncbi:MAG: HD domain-containing protein [Ignavibacteriae bacterium]|nr:HD domain-containing protein [Ignavibacteriota bacterium]
MNFREFLNTKDFFKIISELASDQNVKVFIVGGFVRDLILNREKHEIDFLVIGDGVLFAEKLAEKLGEKNVNIFKNFGTAHFKYQNIDFEFVGARKESYKKESRNPLVEIGTFEDDINRRDFTINTLAISLNEENFGEMIDKFNGIEDIKNKIIKTPIDPKITFDDDPLRIMRAFRFAAQLNFEVDEKILIAAEELSERLKIVSQERITDEFFKILESEKPSIGLKLMQNTKVMHVVFPQIANLAGVDQRKDFHHKDVFLHTCQVVDNISKNTNDVWLRFAALVHDIAKPQTKKFIEEIGWTFHGHEELGARMMKSIFKQLKLPLHKLNYVEKLVRLHLRPIALASEEVTDSAVRRLSANAGEDLDDLITLCRADITSKDQNKVSKYLQNYENVMKKVRDVQEKDNLRAFQSPVTGNEIMEICNLKPSKKVGEIKTAIEEAILDGIIPNEYNAAFQYLMNIKENFLK